MSAHQVEARVASIASSPPYTRVLLRAPTLAVRLRPGQFLTAALGGPLRTPLWPAAIDGETVGVLVNPSHPLAALAPQDPVDLLGPLGRPLPWGDQPPDRLLLVADVEGLPQLLTAADRVLAGGGSVALLFHAPSTVPLPAFLPPAMEVHRTSPEGLADLSPFHLQGLIAWADRLLVAVGPNRDLLPLLAGVVQEVRIGSAQGFAWLVDLPTIVCGVGACRACAVPLRSGYRRACVEGPAFDLLELEVR